MDKEDLLPWPGSFGAWESEYIFMNRPAKLVKPSRDKVPNSGSQVSFTFFVIDIVGKFDRANENHVAVMPQRIFEFDMDWFLEEQTKIILKL